MRCEEQELGEEGFGGDLVLMAHEATALYVRLLSETIGIVLLCSSNSI